MSTCTQAMHSKQKCHLCNLFRIKTSACSWLEVNTTLDPNLNTRDIYILRPSMTRKHSCGNLSKYSKSKYYITTAKTDVASLKD